jgi:hypothetical protein
MKRRIGKGVLALAKETLRRLSDEQLAHAMGGSIQGSDVADTCGPACGAGSAVATHMVCGPTTQGP